MTHIIKLLYGTDKRNPTRELSLTDLDANIYLQENGTAPGGGQLNPLWSGRSSRFDGERKLNESRENTKLEIMYSLSADNTQHLQVVQRKISRFFMECSPHADKRKKVWLEYRWSVDGLDDLARPVLGQLNHYLEVLHADVAQWPNALHSGQMVAGYVEGVSLEITGKPYWEGLEDRAADADGLAETTDSTIKYTLGSSEVTADFTIATWITHRASDYVVFEYYVDASNYVRLEWDQSDGRFEIVQNDAGTPTTTNGGAQTLSAGTKYHLAVIQDDTGNTLKSYLNGVADVSATDQTMSNGGALYFGSAASVATAANSTGLDARRVWSTNITAAQLLALYTAEQAIITAGETIQYPLYLKTNGDGIIPNAIINSSGAAAAAVAYYKLEEDTTADRVDSSPNGYDLTASGSISAATGKINNGAQLTTASSENLFTVNAGAVAALVPTDADFTICAWVNLDNTSALMNILRGQDATNYAYRMFYSLANDAFSFGVYTNPDLLELAETTVGSPSTGTWYFVVCYHDATGNEIGISVNNNTFTTSAWTHGTGGTAGSPSSFRIGNSSSNLDGIVDEVAVYDYVLTADEITALYNAGGGLNEILNSGIIYGCAGDSLSKIRLEADLPTSDTDRVVWAGLLPADSSYIPSDVHYLDFNATLGSFVTNAGGGYTAASVTSGSGTDTATIETTLTTPGDLQPGRYRVLAHLRIVGGSATTATVTPYFRIGETTSPESYGTDNSVATNAGFLWQDLGDLNIGWPMDTLVKMTVGLKFAETAAVTLTPAIDFIMLMPAAAVKATCEDSTITIASGDTLHIDEKSAWVTDNSNSDSQLYHFHHEGNPLRAMPYKYNYLFFINGEDNQSFTISNSSTVRVYVTPRWALPGGLVA